MKLSTIAVARLHQEYLLWTTQFRPSEKAVSDGFAFGYHPVWKGSLTNGETCTNCAELNGADHVSTEYQLFKTKSDKKQYAIPDAFALLVISSPL